jgi:hypothetical protein
VYHFVHGYGAVGYCDEADDYAVDVVPGLYEHLVVRSKVVVAYATVLFFSLYLACIWSILGTWPCRDSFVVVSHRRAGVKVALRVRCNRGSDRAHEAQVQEFKDRSDWFRRGDANDIFGCELRLERTLAGMMRASKFAAGIYRFGTSLDLGLFFPEHGDVIFDIYFSRFLFSSILERAQGIGIALQHISHRRDNHVLLPLRRLQRRTKEIQMSNLRTPIVRFPPCNPTAHYN